MGHPECRVLSLSSKNMLSTTLVLVVLSRRPHLCTIPRVKSLLYVDLEALVTNWSLMKQSGNLLDIHLSCMHARQPMSFK